MLQEHIRVYDGTGRIFYNFAELARIGLALSYTLLIYSPIGIWGSIFAQSQHKKRRRLTRPIRSKPEAEFSNAHAHYPDRLIVQAITERCAAAGKPVAGIGAHGMQAGG
jgi:hypothetical protein